MKEYAFDNGKEINIEGMRAEDLPFEEYGKFHQAKVMVCHDVFIFYKGGILLIHRKGQPAKGLLWPIGGGIRRGTNIEESLKEKTKEECGLDLSNIKELGLARTFFETEPFNHGKGTDTLNLVFTAKGHGTLRLNELHEKPIIIRKEDYTKEFKERLHPYVKDFMDKAIKCIDK